MTNLFDSDSLAHGASPANLLRSENPPGLEYARMVRCESGIDAAPNLAKAGKQVTVLASSSFSFRFRL